MNDIPILKELHCNKCHKLLGHIAYEPQYKPEQDLDRAYQRRVQCPEYPKCEPASLSDSEATED